MTSFRQQINLPLRVGLVIDASTSIRTRFQFEQQAAIEFLLQMIKPGSDRAFVMGFAEVPHISQDWTNNLDALETGVNKLKPAGGTALFDSVYVACRDKLLDTRAGRSRCARPSCSSPTAKTTRAACIPTKPSRCASAPRPSSTPSAPTGRPAAARATK